MKRSILVFALSAAVFTCLAFAQAPAGGAGQRGAGAPGGGGGGGGQRGRGAAPPATGPIADLTNKVVEAYNKKDAAFFAKTLLADSVWLDEDGHMMAGPGWLNRSLNAPTPKTLTITNLRVRQTGENAAWAAFNYTMDETTAAGAANKMTGLGTIFYEKTGAEWQISLIHAPVNGLAITPH